MHRLVSKSILLLTLSSSLVIVGCGSGSTPNVVVQETTKPPMTLEFPGEFNENVVYGLMNNGIKVKVGDPIERFNQAFPKPRRAFDLFDSPRDLDKSFLSRGWTLGTDSVACVSVEGQVVLVMETIDKSNDAGMQELMDETVARFGQPTQKIVDEKFNYAFWLEPGTILMVGNALAADGTMSITTAVGHPKIMEHQGMTPALVTKSIEKAKAKLNPTKTP